MKFLFILFAIFITCNVIAQDKLQSIKPKIDKDGEIGKNKGQLPEIIYNSTEDKKFGVIINGQFRKNFLVESLHSESIESIQVEKGLVVIENEVFDRIITIELKDGYILDTISLSDLCEKYLHLNEGISVFFLNNRIIECSRHDCLVDENSILKIIVTHMNENEANIGCNIIQMFTNK